ncbi:hypothetical protein [Mycobacterium camsae]|uniref:hypothetical protein n=1 Tax=Mycobacterium gordonae TaxID=1778 RepID=UPI00197F5FF8|nr:hypothetical protein [Mycobacterium gordonae]
MPDPREHDDLDAFDIFDADEVDRDSSADPDVLELPDEDVAFVQSVVDPLDNDYAAQDEPVSQDTCSALDAIDASTEPEEAQADGEEEAGVQLFSVVNPSDSVLVSALMDGRTQRVKLSPEALKQTESELAQEIIILAELARQKGLAGQRTYLLENAAQTEGLQEVRDFGLDGKEILQAFMDSGMQLPTPEQAQDAQAEVFAARYQQ